MDHGDEHVVGPNGLPLVDAELDVLRSEYSQWQEQNPGEELALGDYASTHFFTTDSAVSDNEVATVPAERLYPNLGQSVTVQRGPLPVLNRMNASKLPVLERITSKSMGKASARERIASPAPMSMPALERIASPAPEMPALERIVSSAAMAMPALERISTAVSVEMPVLERISSFSARTHLPTLERDADADFTMRASDIRASMDRTRGHGMDALFRPRTTAVVNASAVQSNKYDSLYDEEDMDATALASVVHNFSVIRESFAKNKATMAHDIGASRNTLMSFAAELREALAAVDARDEHRASLVRSRNLSHDALAKIACAPNTDTMRAAFVVSGSALADLLIDRHASDAEIRGVLIGLKPIIFIGAMYEAWKRLMSRIVKAMGNDVTAESAIAQAFQHFGPIASEITQVGGRKTSPATIETRIAILSAMASTITVTSIMVVRDKARRVSQSLQWMDDLLVEVQNFSGMEGAEEATTDGFISQSLFTKTSLEGKVSRGLKNIVDTALAASPGSRDLEARRGTSEFLTKYFGKFAKDAEKIRKPAFIRAYVSALCGVMLMRTIERTINNIRALESMREKYVLTPMREARELILEQRDFYPINARR